MKAQLDRGTAAQRQREGGRTAKHERESPSEKGKGKEVEGRREGNRERVTYV